MRINAKCYGCVWFSKCDKELERKCSSQDYILFTTQTDKDICDIICGDVENDKYEY